MPSWRLHEKWTMKMGIPETVCKEINELVDSPRRWLNKKEHPEVRPSRFLLFCHIADKRGHDVGKSDKRLYERRIVLEYIYEIFGLEGVKAAILHYVLDTMVSLLRFYTAKIRDEVLKIRLRHKFRDLLQYYSDSDIVDIQLHYAAIEVFAFVEGNLDAIKDDLINEMRERGIVIG